jgi:hypothetical protein
MQRRWASALRNMPDFAAVSNRALIGRCALVGSFVQYWFQDGAKFQGRDSTVGQTLRRRRCSGVCSGRVGVAWLLTGPILNARGGPRRVPLLGPEARE